jgi:hypothetical protein
VKRSKGTGRAKEGSRRGESKEEREAQGGDQSRLDSNTMRVDGSRTYDELHAEERIRLSVEPVLLEVEVDLLDRLQTKSLRPLLL